MNALIIGGMGLSGVHMTILNTLAFGPVPLMLYVFNVLKQRKGIRFSFQVSLLSFALSILGLLCCNRIVMGNNMFLKLIVGGLSSIIGSYSIASFFLMSYLVPAQISTVEEQLTKKNHSAMYFAAQAVTTSATGATSGSLL
ncbi:MAG: hypothetical protein MJ219_02295 [Mycoplasmoidaceae bacterium]|nr:hypothetical protein [Mycoplasmoidaceae bacterium]